MQNCVVVFFGGRSFEHDVSIITGLQAVANINKYKYNILPVYITKGGKWLTGERLKNIKTYKNFCEKGLAEVLIKPGADGMLFIIAGKKIKPFAKIVAAVVATHGGEGEDGTLAAQLAACGIAKTCGNLLSCALTMSKSAGKIMLSKMNAPVLPALDAAGLSLTDFPVIIKPDVLGSSIGISVCKNMQELKKAQQLCTLMGTKPLIEPYLTDFCEYNIAAFKKVGDGENKIVLSDIEKPARQGEVLSYENKYMTNSTMQGMERELPAKIDAALKTQIEKLAVQIYEQLDLGGVCRIDFLYDNKAKQLYVNEINTIPGSLAFYLYKSKITFTMLLDELIKSATEQESLCKRSFSFSSQILDKFCESAGKK